MNLPADDTNLETAFLCTDYPTVELDDNDFINQDAHGEHSIFEFKNQFSDNKKVILAMAKVKSSRATSSSTTYLQIYNRDTPGWETMDSDNATGADTEFTLNGTQSTNLSDYYDGSYWVSFRVYQMAQ